jgi:hypothetical protein
VQVKPGCDGHVDAAGEIGLGGFEGFSRSGAQLLGAD